MANTPAFMKAFPLTAKAAVHTPLVFRAGLYGRGRPALALPRGNPGLRPFRGGRGWGYPHRPFAGQARRIACRGSRFRWPQSVFPRAPATFAMGTAQIRADQRPEGFLLAVFSFTTPEQEERASLRALLKSFGFRKLAQNTYIHGRIETEGLKAAVRGLGLENNFFLFNLSGYR